MSREEHWLRRLAGAQIVKFGLAKLPITIVTVTVFLSLRKTGVETLWATVIVSMMAQTCDFFVQRKWVFRDARDGWRTVLRQALLFFLGAIAIAGIEGAWLSVLQEKTGMGDFLVYVLGHAPIFFLRYAYERQFVFRPRPPRSP